MSDYTEKNSNLIPRIDIPCFAWNSQAEQGLLFFKAKSLPDKDLIESALQHSNMNLVETLLQDLRLIYPHDRDFYFYQCIYFLTIKQYEQAQNIITDCLRKFPTSYECYYYQASIYQAQNMTLPALKNYEIGRAHV